MLRFLSDLIGNIEFALFLSIAALWPLVVLLATAIVVLIPRRIRHWMNQRDLRADEPRCLRCRYIVKGVTSGHCPECGADLSAGVLVPHPLPPLSPKARAKLWTVVLLPGVLMLGYYTVGKTLPPCNQLIWHLTVSSPRIDSSEFQIDAVGVGRGNRLTMGVAMLELIGRLGFMSHSPFRVMRVDLLSKTYQAVAQTHGHRDPSQPLTLEAIHSFVPQAVPDENPALRSSIASDLMAIINAAEAGRAPESVQLKTLRVVHTYVETRFDPPAIYPITYWLGAIVFTVWFARARARQEARAGTAPAVPLVGSRST